MISAHAWLQPQTAFAREFDEVHPVGEIEKVSRARGDGESEHRYFYHRAEQMVRYAGDWIEQNKEKDFFLYLHLMDSHTPHFLDEDARRFLSDAELAEVDVGRFRQDGHGPKDAGPPLSPAERRYLDALYDGSLLYLDRHLGRMFERLRRLGTLDHTLIAVTSDHGENLAEVSGRFGHAGTWNDIVARIPLILFYSPGLDAKRVSALTEGVDLLPTILGLLDVSLPDSKRADGRDLAAALESDATGGGQAFMRNAIRTDRIKCVFRSEEEVLDPGEAPPVEAVSAELYDLATDPLETRNIWAERPREAEKCLQLFRSRMLPLHRRYRATMTGEQPEAPFAIAATYI
jgi:arylsulfatase A-like enzyme